MHLRAATPEDAQAATDLYIAGDIEEVGEIDYSLGDLQDEWRDLDLARDTLIVSDDAGTIVGSLVYLFVLENLLQIIPGLDDIIAKYGFGGLSNGLFAPDPDSSSDVLGQLPAGLLLTGYAAVLVVAGILVVQRRDVTA